MESLKNVKNKLQEKKKIMGAVNVFNFWWINYFGQFSCLFSL